MLGRRSVRRSVRRGRREAVRTVRVRKGEMSTSPPEKLTKHLLPCHVRLLDGTDLYCQLPVSYMSRVTCYMSRSSSAGFAMGLNCSASLPTTLCGT